MLIPKKNGKKSSACNDCEKHGNLTLALNLMLAGLIAQSCSPNGKSTEEKIRKKITSDGTSKLCLWCFDL